jgi:hypothetical protein
MATLDTKFAWQSITPISDDPTQRNNPGEYLAYFGKRPDKHRWAWDLHFAPNAYVSAMELYSFLVSQGGTGGVWNLPNPSITNGSLQVVGNAKTRAIIPKGDLSAPVDALSANAAGVLLPGDFFQFANHKKVYMVTNTVNANGSEQGTIQFYPPAFERVPDNTNIVIGNDVLFQVQLDSDITDVLISANRSKFADPKIDVVEVG